MMRRIVPMAACTTVPGFGRGIMTASVMSDIMRWWRWRWWRIGSPISKAVVRAMIMWRQGWIVPSNKSGRAPGKIGRRAKPMVVMDITAMAVGIGIVEANVNIAI